ncbi:glycosyltransferase 87 family protein [Nocardia thailandica]
MRATPDTRQVRWLGAAIWLCVISATISVLTQWWYGYIDLQVYRAGAQVWLDGGDLYGPLPEVMGIALPFTYPPLAAAFFAPLALMPLPVAEIAVLLTSILSIGITLWLVLGRVRPGLDRLPVLTIVVAGVGFAQFLEPVRQTLSFGQINLVLMAAISLDVLAKRTFWPRGMLIGIAVSIKLIPAAYLLYFLLRRDWKAVGTMLVSAAAAIGVGFLLFPEDSTQFWLHTLTDTTRIGQPYFAGNQSIKGTLCRLGLPDATTTALWLTLSFVTVILAAIWMHRLLSVDRTVAALLVNAAAVLLVSPVSWSHHWVWVAPALLVGVDAFVRGRRSPGYVTALGSFTIMFLVGPQWLLGHAGDKELAWTWWEQIIGSSYVWSTFAVLVYAVCAYHPRRAGGYRSAVRKAESAAA